MPCERVAGAGGRNRNIPCPTGPIALDVWGNASFIEEFNCARQLSIVLEKPPYFTDVPSGAFGFAWIQRMREENITSGCTVRGDMAIFLMRGAFNQFLPAGTPVVSKISPSTLGLGTSQTESDTRRHNRTHYRH